MRNSRSGTPRIVNVALSAKVVVDSGKRPYFDMIRKRSVAFVTLARVNVSMTVIASELSGMSTSNRPLRTSARSASTNAFSPPHILMSIFASMPNGCVRTARYSPLARVEKPTPPAGKSSLASSATGLPPRVKLP